ncbi:MAG: N-acetylneuraminate synthase family protein [Candidatus Omnitrophota bacterium]|jgi:N,N'-diacetyllegionaminate synthase
MKPIIVAEAATNHNGDIVLAKEMIYAAKEAGADYIKFQSWQIKNMDPKNPAYEMMKPKELSDEAHRKLISESEKAGIKFLTTCFDIARIDFLASLGMEAIKVASTDAGSIRMLKMLRERFKVIILSVGMAYPQEVEEAVGILKQGKFYLLHCVGLYPTPAERANLARIEWLRRFTPNVGYSDHTLGVEAAQVAVAMGAKIIEKHFTLRKDPNNVFSQISVLPEGLKAICDFAKKYEALYGEKEAKLSEEEIANRKKFIGRWGDNK